MKITILGAGAFGKALGDVAEYNGHVVKFYDPAVFPNVTIEDTVSEAEAIIYVAPSDKHSEILPHLPKDVPLICASKGFLSTKPFLKFQNFSALGGAAFATDITSKKKNVTLTSSSDLAEHLFSTEKITVEYTPDTLGILLCGSLKNVYAIGAGLYGNHDQKDRNQETDNAAKENITHFMPYLETAVTEMRQILAANHADENTLKLSCGAADLVLSCSPSSRNFRFGLVIKNHESKEDATTEGLAVIESLSGAEDFVIPESVTTFKDITKAVNNYINH